MHHTVLQLKINRLIFEVYASAGLIFYELQIRKIRPSIRVKPYPGLGAAYLGLVDAYVTAQLPGVKILDGQLKMSFAYRKEVLARDAVFKCGILELKFEWINGDAENLSIEDHPDVRHLR